MERQVAGSYAGSRGGSLDLVLFLALNAILLVRPQEWIPGLQLPFYEILILCCVLVTVGPVFEQVNSRSLASNPISLCVLGVFAGIVLSHVAHSWLEGARTTGIPFLKVVLYYFLLVGVARSPWRLRVAMGGLVLCISLVTFLAVLQYHDVIDIAGWDVTLDGRFDKETGDLVFDRRMVGVGIFNDPNDLALILVVGIALGLYFATEPAASVARLFWLAQLALFVYGLTLTRSRGGLIALLAGAAVLVKSRFGWWRTLPLFAIALPAALLLFGSRQTNILASLESDTGQGRIQIWSEGLALFRRQPLFGIGAGQYQDNVGFVAHNSFVHCYAELGMFGGTFFAGAFCCALWSMAQLARGRPGVRPPGITRLGPYLTAALCAYAAGVLSLSRSYELPTYIVLGLVAAYVRVASGGGPVLPLNGRLVGKLALASVLIVVALHAVVEVFVDRGVRF